MSTASVRSRWSVGILVALLLTLAGCHGGSAQTRVVIAGGAAGGVYSSYGQTLAEVLEQHLRADVEAVETEGSVDNLRRVASGEALLGFAQADAAADAVAGVGAFAEPLPIEAVARVYDEYMHIVVSADSDVVRLGDLAGRPVSLGAPGSGVHVIAERVLAAAGLPEDAVEDRRLGVSDSIAALRAGEIEAFFWVGGVPTPGIEELSMRFPLRLLPIAPDIVEQVNSGHAGVYRASDFPLLAYGAEQRTPTMTVPNYLITSAAAPDDLVRETVEVLFDSRSRIAESVPTAVFLDRRQAIFTEPVKLHAGAARYYVASHR